MSNVMVHLCIYLTRKSSVNRMPTDGRYVFVYSGVVLSALLPVYLPAVHLWYVLKMHQIQ